MDLSAGLLTRFHRTVCEETRFLAFKLRMKMKDVKRDEWTWQEGWGLLEVGRLSLEEWREAQFKTTHNL